MIIEHLLLVARLLQWVTTQGATQTQHVSVETQFAQSETGKVSTSYSFMPSVGVHFFRYELIIHFNCKCQIMFLLWNCF